MTGIIILALTYICFLKIFLCMKGKLKTHKVVPLIIFLPTMTIDCFKFPGPKLVKHTLKFELRSKLLFF